MQQATHMAAYSVAANKSNSLSEAMGLDDPALVEEILSGNKVKTLVFSLSSKWSSEKDTEQREKIIRGLNRAISEIFF